MPVAGLQRASFSLRRLVSAIIGFLVVQNVLVYMAFLSVFYKDELKPGEAKTAHPQEVTASSLWLLLRGTATSTLAWASDFMAYLSCCLPDKASNPLIDMFQYSYPSPFTQLWVPVAEDMELACQVGAQAQQEKATMTVIIVPGMFNSASFSLFVRIACLLHSKWNANVIVVDLRGHGQTGRRFPDVPFSLTVLEGRDLLEIAKFARATFDTDSVFLLGISLGGASVLSAAVEGKDCSKVITACATVAAPMDLDNMLVKMSQGSLNIFFMFYTWVLLCHCRSRKIGWQAAKSFHSFVQQVIKPHYAKEFEQALKPTDQKISPMLRLQGLQVPLLAIHSRDDPVIPMEEPLHLKRLSQTQKKEHFVKIQMTEKGGHVGNFSEVNEDIYEFFAGCAGRRNTYSGCSH